MRITAATPRGLTIDALTDGMNDIDALQTQRPHATGREDVVLITHADTDRGYRLACRLLARGVRVVAVARHASSLTRIMHGHSTYDVMTIAADVEDESQLTAVLARAESRLGSCRDHRRRSRLHGGRSSETRQACDVRLARTATKPPPMTSAMPR